MFRGFFVLAPAALLAAATPAVFPLTPAFSAHDTLAATVAAVVAAGAALAIVPLAVRAAHGLPRSGSTDGLVFVVALLSAAAAAIHFAVVKMHFDDYALFGVFFVGAATAQLLWAVWLLLRPSRPLLVLGALGNGLIVALWAVDRIWGLPLGPERWEPEPIGFGDTATSAFEALLVLGCLVLARARPRPVSRPSAIALTAVVTTLTALSLLSVLGVGSTFLTPTR
jgi:hypothetical protein